MKYEDDVRDEAKIILGFDDDEPEVKQGTGQIKTFNQLGFDKVIDKPDGWYLPNNTVLPAIILEAKSQGISIHSQKAEEELKKNVNIVLTKYKNCIGILYNGIDIRVFRNNVELAECSNKLEHKDYYLSLCRNTTIDKEKIYNLTKRINECLNKDFGITNLKHRMIFTACALVALRYGAKLSKGMDYATFHTSIHSTLSKSLIESKQQNQKLDILLEVYVGIKMNNKENQAAIDTFIDCVEDISESINSDNWNGEDVMGIFFNEFNRYRGKADAGQVFTPDHITSLMYRLIDVNQDDVVLDAACGSGAFLVKSMCNMIKEAGGINTKKASEIKSKQLYGIEFDREIYALACANMLIHKDGKTNLEHLDTRLIEACEWIKSKPITKVLMNPPFETKYGCMTIVENVLNNVPQNTKCAFILPDKKVEKTSKTQLSRLLKHHKLEKIIKLSEKTFSEGVNTSIFIYTAGIPQNGQEIFTCYIEDDGLETVKNKGRQDIKGKWQSIEDYWVNVVFKQSGDTSIKWMKPEEHLSYQMPEKPLEISEEDFRKIAMDFICFKRGIDTKELNEKVLNAALYSSNITESGNNINICCNKAGEGND